MVVAGGPDSEVNAQWKWRSAAEREKIVEGERKVVDDRCRKIIALKREVCDGTDKNFVVINQGGIDPMSLDLFAREKIIGLRRAKRRNLERLALMCGGYPVNSVEGITSSPWDCVPLCFLPPLPHFFFKKSTSSCP